MKKGKKFLLFLSLCLVLSTMSCLRNRRDYTSTYTTMSESTTPSSPYYSTYDESSTSTSSTTSRRETTTNTSDTTTSTRVTTSISETTSTTETTTSEETTSTSDTTTTTDEVVLDSYQKELNSISHVGISYKILDNNVSRNVPTSYSDEGLAHYPIYGQNFTYTDLNEDVLNENISLQASSTTFDSLDSEGYLLLNGTRTGKRLYKHTASNGLYGANPSDSEKAVSKQITVYDPVTLGNYVTGLYAPAGEVVKVEITQEELNKCGGSIEVGIGQMTTRNRVVDIPTSRTFTRMPKLWSKFTITKPTTYVGSFLGGPMYVIPKTQSAAFSVKITGALEYLHYVEGLTTKVEFNRLLNTTSPFFDVELYGNDLRFSGSREDIYPVNRSTLDFENLRDAVRLWKQFSIQSRKMPHGMNDICSISMMFDVYIPMAGASALAIVGADYAVLPRGWLAGALNYKTFMEIGGWGVIHEFNHHYQKFGCNGNNNEVTNNVLNFMEYMMFTRVTESRDYSNVSHGLGLDSHQGIEYYNQYKDTTTGLNTERGYAMLLTDFGPDAMERIANYQMSFGITDADSFYYACTYILKMDFTYLFRDLWHLELSQEMIDRVQALNYPTYIPVGSLYSSSFCLNGIDESNHALPYLCHSEEELDLIGDLITIDGVTLDIIEISDCTNGSLTRLSNGKYRYVADGSGKVSEFSIKFRLTKGTEVLNNLAVTYTLNPNKDNDRDYSLPLEVTYSKETYKLEEFLNSSYTVTSENFEPWDSAHDLDKLFDGNSSTYMHNKRNDIVSEANPIDLKIDLGKVTEFNQIKFYQAAGRNAINKQLPTKITVYGSNDNINFVQVGYTDNLELNNGSTIYKFDSIIQYRYVKIIIRGTYENYIALSNLTFGISEKIKLESLDRIKLYGNVEETSQISYFGHIYRLEENSRLEVDLNTRKALFSMNINSSSYKIYMILYGTEKIDVTNNIEYIIKENDIDCFSLDIGLAGKYKFIIEVSEGYIDFENIYECIT